MPYADDERADPAIHRVMDSFDIAGPHNVGVVMTTAQFRDANPALCAALVGAITEADAFIKTQPRRRGRDLSSKAKGTGTSRSRI
jgi:NitT/TauT family transport system substrate-binding protein